MNKATLFRSALGVCLAAAMSFSAHAADKLIYMNDWLPGGDKAIPFYAQKRGFFAAEGLDVTVQTARGSSEGITKIATGTADVGSGGLAALLQAKAETGIPVTAILGVFTVQPDALFTIEGSHIDSLKDIEGKKVATATFTSSNVVWPLVLKAAGVDASKVTLLKVDPGALAPMLASGRVDATINWSTASPPFVKALRVCRQETQDTALVRVGFDGYGYSVFAWDKMIAEHPDVLRRFAKAYMLAMKAALDNPADVAKAMKSTFPEMDEALVEEQFRTIMPLINNPIATAEGFGTLDKARLAKTWEWTAKAQNMPLDKLDPESGQS